MNIHVWQAAWDGNNVWDTKGTSNADVIDFQLPAVADPRLLQFKFYSTTPASGQSSWESDAFVRRIFLTAPVEVWTFEISPRVIYQNPAPPGVVFNTGDVLTFQVITQSAFRGGQIYVWNPYDSNVNPMYFPESARDDANGISTFRVTLAQWMTSGFHLKLMRPAANNQPAVWEPDASNRVWRPCDGTSLCLKSGQCDVRTQPLALTPVPLEVLYNAGAPDAPQFTLTDLVEGSTFPVESSATQLYGASPLFKVAAYSVQIYPGASYAITSAQNIENPPLQRPFPADPSAVGNVSRCVLGASAWVDAFPGVAAIPLSITPLQASSFSNGVSVQVSLGNGPVYDTVAANRQPDGSWQAPLDLSLNTTTSIRLLPASGTEPVPYAWIDTRRFFTPTAGTRTLWNASPNRVNCTVRLSRSNSRVPNSSSSFRTCCEREGCATCSCCAARVKLPILATAQK